MSEIMKQDEFLTEVAELIGIIEMTIRCQLLKKKLIFKRTVNS